MSIGLKKGKVKIQKHKSKWHKIFQIEKAYLQSVLKDFNVNIQHVGSTSIYHCYAKPIIDIAIGVESLEYGKQLIPLLVKAGYTYDGNADYGVRWFLKKCKGDIRTHFIHIEDYNSRIWQNHIIFRDYLNAYPEKAKEYSDIKLRIEKEFKNDRQGYAKIKDPFIEKTIDEALKTWNSSKKGDDYEL